MNRNQLLDIRKNVQHDATCIVSTPKKGKVQPPGTVWSLPKWPSFARWSPQTLSVCSLPCFWSPCGFVFAKIWAFFVWFGFLYAKTELTKSVILLGLVLSFASQSYVRPKLGRTITSRGFQHDMPRCDQWGGQVDNIPAALGMWRIEISVWAKGLEALMLMPRHVRACNLNENVIELEHEWTCSVDFGRLTIDSQRWKTFQRTDMEATKKHIKKYQDFGHETFAAMFVPRVIYLSLQMNNWALPTKQTVKKSPTKPVLMVISFEQTL